MLGYRLLTRRGGLGTRGLAADEGVPARGSGRTDLDDRGNRPLGSVGRLVHDRLGDDQRTASAAVEVDGVRQAQVAE